MLSSFVIITPALILATCILVFFEMRTESGKYLSELKEIAEQQTRVMNLIFLKKVIHFFTDSKTSKDTSDILENLDMFAEGMERGASNVASDASSEIADLHLHLNMISVNQRNLASLETMFTIMSRVVLAYGIVIAAMQYFIVLLYVVFPLFAPLSQANDVMVGATLIFGSVIILLYADVAKKIRRIKSFRYEDLDRSSPGDHEITVSRTNSIR